MTKQMHYSIKVNIKKHWNGDFDWNWLIIFSYDKAIKIDPVYTLAYENRELI